MSEKRQSVDDHQGRSNRILQPRHSVRRQRNLLSFRFAVHNPAEPEPKVAWAPGPCSLQSTGRGPMLRQKS
jgi:hypothetical protein